MLILQDVRFLFECAKCFACFSKLLLVTRLKVVLLKDRKLQVLSVFCFQDIPKKELHSKIMSPPYSTTSLKVTWSTIIFFQILTCNVQIMIYFNKGLSSSRAIFKSITCYSECNTWSRTSHARYCIKSAYFWIMSWTLNYTNRMNLKFIKQKSLSKHLKRANLDLLRKGAYKICQLFEANSCT